MTTMEKPASTWSFNQGTLTVHHLGKTLSLGRYATHKFAARAAAAYFAKHGGRCALPRLRSHAGAVAAVQWSSPMPEWYVIFDATAHKNPEGEPAGVHLCSSEKEALGFAGGKPHCGHAVQEIGERVDGELFKRADTAAIEAASVNRRVHQPLAWA